MSESRPSVLDRGRIVRFPRVMDDREREHLREKLTKLIDEEFIGGPRGKLASRLRALLELNDDGELTKTISINADRAVLGELVGSLYDANTLESEQREVHYWRERWKQLEERLRGAKNIRPILREFGLLRSGRERATLHRRLEMAVCYCRLTDLRLRRHVDSPERERWRSGPDQLCKERAFGEIHRDEFEGDSAFSPSPPGETVLAPIPTVLAVHVIDRWFECGGAVRARERLIEAREAFRSNLGHPLVRGRIPDGCDDFEIPNEAKL